MNRFLTFFLVSFFLHIAVGAILLSRAGILGGGKGVKKEVSEVTEFTEKETLESPSSEGDPSEVRSSEPQKKAPRKVKQSKKAKPEKPRKAPSVKPTPKKLPPPVKKAKTSLPEKPLEAESLPPATKEELIKPPEEKKTSVETHKTLSKEKATEEKKESPEIESKSSKTAGQEIIKELKKEIKEDKTQALKIPSEKKTSLESENSKTPSSGGGGEEEPEQKPSFSPTQGGKKGTSKGGVIPALDLGKARKYSQLRQIDGNPIPVYPKEALKKRWEGRVELIYYVNPAGFVEKIQLSKSSGYSLLDNSALRALARYRYYPGQEGWVVHPVEFMLDLEKEALEVAPLGTRSPGGVVIL